MIGTFKTLKIADFGLNNFVLAPFLSECFLSVILTYLLI